MNSKKRIFLPFVTLSLILGACGGKQNSSNNSASNKESSSDHQHIIEHIERKEPTCTDNGYEAYDRCTICSYSSFKAIEKLGHDTIDHPKKDATCTEEGHYAYQTCKRCEYTTYKIIEPLGHQYLNYEAKEATCLAPGYAAYQKCARCGVSNYVEIPKTTTHREGGVMDDNVIPATYFTPGSKDEITYCIDCKKEISRKTVAIPQLTMDGVIYSIEEDFIVTNIRTEEYLNEFTTLDEVIISIKNENYTTVFEESDYQYTFICDTLFDYEGRIAYRNDYPNNYKKFDTVNISGNCKDKYKETRIYNYLNSDEFVTVFGRDISITLSPIEDYIYLEKFNNLYKTIEEEILPYAFIEEMIMDITDSLNYIIDQYYCADIYAGATASPYYYMLSNEILSMYYQLYSEYNSIPLKIANSRYKYDYFGTNKDEEIEQMIAILDPETSMLDNANRVEMNNAEAQYNSGNLTMEEALSTYVRNANEIAKRHDYADYMYYCYENEFGREYSVEETSLLAEFMKFDVTEIRSNLSEAYMNVMSSSPTNFTKAKDDLSTLFFGHYLNYLAEYADVIGDEYKDNFDNFFSRGNYFYSAIPNDNITGYINTFTDGTPFMFLGSGYQDTATFVHEFGHYNALYLSQGDFISYDLAETHSQGNELLFGLWMYNNCKDYTKDQLAYYLLCALDEMTSTIQLGYIVNEIEKWVYSQNSFTKEEIFNLWDSLCDEYGLSYYQGAYDYISTVLMGWHGYYISYGISAMSSIELFARAFQDFDSAVDAYKIIYADYKENPNATFTSVIEDAGLYSVFSQDCFSLLKNSINSFCNSI